MRALAGDGVAGRQAPIEVVATKWRADDGEGRLPLSLRRLVG